MKIVQKLVLVLLTFIICQYSLTAKSPTHFNYIIIDTIPQVEPEYKGNRIVVKSIKVIKKKGKSYKIEYKLVNNGRNKIKLGKPSSIPKDLIIQFDNSLVENDLIDAKSAIIESIKKQSISIRPGQLIMGIKTKFTHRQIPPTDRIASENKKVLPKEKIVENELPKMKESEEQEIPKTKLDKSVKDIVEDIPHSDYELENPRNPNQSSPKPDEVKTKKTHLGETILVTENEPSNKLEIAETESILEVLPNKNAEKNEREIISEKADKTPKLNIEKEEIIITKVVGTENIDTLSNEKNEEQEIIEIVKEENIENQNSNEKLCADLIIENVKILKKNKRFVLVNYTIKNVGNIPISLHGETKKEMDNIAIQSHFTRSHNLTRGSIPVDISFIKKGNREVKGMMVPGESITLKLKIETSKVTKFTPVLALTLNPSSSNFECNRLNNVFFIDIAEKAPGALNSKPKKSFKEDSMEELSTLEN